MADQRRSMKPIHVSRPNPSGVRKLYTRCSRRHVVGGKNALGELLPDWCPNRGAMGRGWYWVMLDGSFSKTFPRLKEAVADFERERRERRAASKNRNRKGSPQWMSNPQLKS